MPVQMTFIKLLFYHFGNKNVDQNVFFIGAQFGTIVSMPLSGLLSEYGFDGGWPSIFYVFGFVGVIWSVAFLIFVYEDPSSHPNINEKEKKYIISSLWGTSAITVSLKNITGDDSDAYYNSISALLI